MNNNRIIEQLMDDIGEIHRQTREKIYCLSHGIYYTTHMFNDQITYISEKDRNGYHKWLSERIDEYSEHLNNNGVSGSYLCFEEWLGYRMTHSVSTLKEMKQKMRRYKLQRFFKFAVNIHQAIKPLITIIIKPIWPIIQDPQQQNHHRRIQK